MSEKEFRKEWGWKPIKPQNRGGQYSEEKWNDGFWAFCYNVLVSLKSIQWPTSNTLKNETEKNKDDVGRVLSIIS